MKESLLTEIFLHAGLFFMLGGLIVPLLRYFKIPNALGYLLAGIIVGPFGLGALPEGIPFLDFISLNDTEYVKILAELSIVFLLFVIGLELTPARLWQMRSLVFGLGGAQVLASTVVIGAAAYFWGNNIQISILLGLSLALSSTAMVMQWLQEQKLFTTPQGKASFSILLLQDLAVIPILFLLTIFSAEYAESVYDFIFVSLLKMITAIFVIYFAGKFILKYIFHFANKHGGSEVFIAFSLLIIVVSSSIAYYAGLSMALGAFLAGLLLAETEYRHEVSSFIVPFKSLLLGIFFFSFGMGINLGYIGEKPFWLLSSVIGLMFIKAIIIFFLCKLWKQSTATSVESGILLSQAGEFGLLVVGSALTASLISEDVGQFMLIMVGITMLLTPIITPLARKAGQAVEDLEHNKNSSLNISNEDISGSHIIILGYGRIGNNIGNDLCSEGFSIIAFDKDIEKVSSSQKKSYPVFLGDALKQSTLKAADLEMALCVIITLDDEEATRKVVSNIRKMNSSIPIIVRAHSEDSAIALREFEKIELVNEDAIISKELSKLVVEQCLPLVTK